jgi:hypothetical protein
MGVEGTLVDAAVGWLVQSILGSLLTDKLEAWAREVGLADDARRLEREMRGVEAVLAAARGRVLVDRNEVLAQSMEELRDLLYDAATASSARSSKVSRSLNPNRIHLYSFLLKKNIYVCIKLCGTP